MVPNISRNGTSFRGAGAYHLHDKPAANDPRPRSTKRITFTAARNLANDDPHAALDEMWRTAVDAPHLKSGSGAAARGRRSPAPVKTISLAWAPGQAPGQHHMTSAADALLKAMGWHEHQALYVAHSDTAHPHIHIILNRVHPDTGRTLNDWQERKRAQAWALSYERETGAVLCKARELPHQTARRPASASLPYPQAKAMAAHSRADAGDIQSQHRRQSRSEWARLYRAQEPQLAVLNRARGQAEALAVSLAREGDTAAAWRALGSAYVRHHLASRQLAQARAALACAQLARLTARIHQLHAGAQSANDNSREPKRPITACRFSATLRATPAATATLRSLSALQRGERRQLRAMQAAAYALARQHRGAAVAAARARSEVALAFASRWADIGRLPPNQRLAAIAALKAEEAAALSARLAYHHSQASGAQRVSRLALLHEHAQARRALAYRHKLAWTAAAIAMKHPARGPPRPGHEPGRDPMLSEQTSKWEHPCGPR
jgi:hypothetical protein